MPCPMQKLLRWMRGRSEDCCFFRNPLDCFVSTDGKNRFGVMIAGQVLTQNLNDLRTVFEFVPEDLLWIPTDTMKIRADIFERELFTSLV